MATNVPEFRDDTMQDPAQLRLRLNQLVKAVNAQTPRFKVMRFASVTNQNVLIVPNPGFPVGAIVLGQFKTTDGSTPSLGNKTPTVSWFTQPDGQLNVTLGYLTSPERWTVTLVLFEGEGSA